MCNPSCDLKRLCVPGMFSRSRDLGQRWRCYRRVSTYIMSPEILEGMRIVRSGSLHRAGGEKESSISSATPRKQGGHPGVIRNITFDNISMTAESSLFIAGERFCD